MAERQRCLQVPQRLAVCVHTPRPEPCLAKRLSGDRVATGGLFVTGDLRKAPGVVATRGLRAEDLRHAPVQEPAPRQAGVLVRGIPDARMPEVERRLTAPGHLADDPPPHKLLERADRLVLGATARGADRLEVEGAPDDGCGGEHL